MTLELFQARLLDHFKALRAQRSSTAGDEPIFGLEHGLEHAELEELNQAIREHTVRAPPRKDHRLPWIVYACEFGYRYSGDEYWQTFESETPGWEAERRHWIRDCFAWFHTEFGGARPSGPWANHFSIICWPITHAILPRDLQVQFAEILYNMRDLFSAELLTSPMALGERIAARSWNASSRLQNLAQEPLLIGQIATALLLQGVQGSESLILPATLKRIGEDLDQVRTAREWLRGAQRIAQQRTQFRGLSPGRAQSTDRGRLTPADRAREQVAALVIEPRLVLRPSAANSWDVMLELPDFSPLLVKFPGLRSLLLESRCVVAGSSGRPLARGALLHGPQQVLLRAWPSPSDVLLQFEQPIPSEFEYLLRADCLLRPGPQWLFRIASDGLAHELRSRLVRPGHSYMLARSAEPFKAGFHVLPVHLACEGIHGGRLEMPDAISPEWAGDLSELGLNQARSVHVWPAGLSAANWDGEGRGEWLTTERPCIGILPDHLVDSVTVTLGNTEVQRLEVASPAPGCPVFIELPPLSVGVHQLRIVTRSATSATEEQAGGLDIVIREPRTWMPGANGPGALRISIDPPAPTLEQMWEGRVAIEVRAPARSQVIPTISLFERHVSTPSVLKRLPPLPVPADASAWRSHFEKHFRDARDVQTLYDLAYACHLDLNAGELGTFSVTCEREFSPLRWVIRRRGSGHELMLADDSGFTSPPVVSRYEFATPDNPVQIDAAQFSTRYAVPPSGGLYRACTTNHERAVILPPDARGLTLRELGAHPRVQDRPRSVDTIQALLKLIRLWARARLPGDVLSAIRQQEVLRVLIRHLFLALAGAQWEKAESSFGHGTLGLRQLQLAVSETRREQALASALANELQSLATLSTEAREARFCMLASECFSPPPQVIQQGSLRIIAKPKTSCGVYSSWLCSLAFRLASVPHEASDWAGVRLIDGVKGLMEIPALARAARFLVLAIDREAHARAGVAGHVYADWEWK